MQDKSELDRELEELLSRLPLEILKEVAALAEALVCDRPKAHRILAAAGQPGLPEFSNELEQLGVSGE